MAKLVYVAGPLFSDAERAFLEQIVNTLAESAGLDPLADFFLPHRAGGSPGDSGRFPRRIDKSVYGKICSRLA